MAKDTPKARIHPDFAAKIVAKLPPKLREEAEVDSKAPGYSIIRVRGRSLASVRDANCRIIHAHDASASAAGELAKLVAASAPEAPAPEKPKAAAKAKTKTPAKPKTDASESKTEGGDDGEAK